MANVFYEITAEQAKNFNTYVPLTQKMDYAEFVAHNCLVPMEIQAGNDSQTVALPPMYKEDIDRKSRYLMGALVVWYLRGTFEEEDEKDKALMSTVEYDKWAGGHILNQIERLKKNRETSNICFDLMSDYKDLEKKVNAECYAMVQAMNDPVSRQLAGMAASMTPEALKEAMNNLKTSQEEVEKYVAEHGNNKQDGA